MAAPDSSQPPSLESVSTGHELAAAVRGWLAMLRASFDDFKNPWNEGASARP